MEIYEGKINPPHTTTHNGLYTSICIISTKLVVHSTLAYEWNFSHILEEVSQASIYSKQNDSGSPLTWISFMFSFPI